MHQFGWLSESGGNFLNLLQKEGVTSEKVGGGGSNPGGNYNLKQYDQRNNLILSGKTDSISDEDLEETVTTILSDIDVQMTANDVEACHRIGQSSSAL